MSLYSVTSPLPINMERRRTFNPSRIDGLQLWLDATKGLFDATSGGNPVTTDDATVARWEDQSGNSNHFTQATTNDRPKLKTYIKNNKNIIRFDGVFDSMQKTAIFTSQPYTIFFVFSFASGGRMMAGIVNNWLFGSWNGKSNRAFNGGWVFEGTSTSTAFQLATFKCNSSGSIYYQNTTQFGSSGGTGSPSGLIIGRGDAGTNPDKEPAAGDICEIVAYNKDLSATNLTLVNSYLNSKWAVY